MNAPRLLLVLLALSCALLIITGVPSDFIEGVPRSWKYLSRLGHPSPDGWQRISKSIAETLLMSFCGTTLAMISAIPLSYFATRGLSNKACYFTSRVILTFLRSVPMIILGIFFVATLGLGATAGIMSLWLHTTGVFGKYLSEFLEATDSTLLDAASIDGASTWQCFWYILLPVEINELLTLLLYYYEANFRGAAVLGFVGAGGIGMEMAAAVGSFDYGRVSFVIILIVATDVLIDFLSRLLRGKALEEL